NVHERDSIKFFHFTFLVPKKRKQQEQTFFSPMTTTRSQSPKDKDKKDDKKENKSPVIFLCLQLIYLQGKKRTQRKGKDTRFVLSWTLT
ncbi:hypothetical protein, partial [Vibrio cholerae]|uniref:hypothetical protein n=1 Tax=Vibrio cholerae TaxID=666 RepID=UPI001F272CFF